MGSTQDEPGLFILKINNKSIRALWLNVFPASAFKNINNPLVIKI